VTAAALITPEDFWPQFGSCEHSMFRLETLQRYQGSDEEEDLAAFTAGHPRPGANRRKNRWTDMLTARRLAGKTQQRVHIITEPLTAYVQWELTWGYEPNIVAGEDIRIIPAAQGTWPAGLPREDFWLFDSSRLYAMRYDPDGTWLGAEPITGPAGITQACRWRDTALYQAVPWREYLASRLDLKRRLAA